MEGLAVGDSALPTNSDSDSGRAGSLALSTFARILVERNLRAHVDGPLTSGELEARLGWAAKASLRLATGNLCEIGALARRADAATGSATTELTEAGRGLLRVADAIEGWLSHSPFGPLVLPDPAARGTIRALVAGWDSAIVRALAERPRSLSELNSELTEQSYPTLKRRLARLRTASLVERVGNRGRSPAHAATDWLRRAVGPLIFASRWERSHAAAVAPPMTKGELEAALLLALPLVEFPKTTSGECVLAAPASPGRGEDAETALAAVSLVVQDGKVVACSPGAEDTPKTWVLGTPDAWLEAMADGHCEDLRLRGTDRKLVETVVTGLHGALLGGLSSDA
jgi:DNA-binding HxlR family transcriptional regulator